MNHILKKLTIFILICVTLISAQENNIIYVGLRLGGSIGMVYPVGNEYYDYFGAQKDPSLKWRDGGSFDIAPFLSLQLTDKFALQTEVMITRFGYEGEVYKEQYYGKNYEYKVLLTRRALVIPILARYTLRQNKFNLSLYAGPHITANVGKWLLYMYERYGDDKYEETITATGYGKGLKCPPLGLTMGTNFGYITANAGTIFFDVRLLGDLGLVKRYDEFVLYRAKLSFSIGYEFGFGERN